MNIYHITWFDTDNDHTSRGENFMAHTPALALTAFSAKYPKVIFLSCVSMEVLNRKGICDQSQP